MLVSDRKALRAMKTLTRYCVEHTFCKNCIFSAFNKIPWECCILTQQLKMEDSHGRISQKTTKAERGT